MKQNKIVTVFGGTGFLGRYIVSKLSDAGMTVRVATRNPKKAYFLKPKGNVGQITAEHCSYRDETSIGRAIGGSDYVVNCVGILYESKKGAFERIHSDLPETIAKVCASLDVERLIHISSLGVDFAKSKYAETKLSGEIALLDHFPDATIVRPSLLFGREDDFFNKFASMAQIMPVLPLIGGGKTLFQPVYVDDVAEAVLKTLGMNSGKGTIYELGGAEVLSFKELLLKLLKCTDQKAMLVYMPFIAAKLMAILTSFLPKPILTLDQLRSLKFDNIVVGDKDGFEDLGIDPVYLDTILPKYLGMYKNESKFSKRQDA